MEIFASSFSTLGWLRLGQSPASSPAKMGMGESRKNHWESVYQYIDNPMSI